MKRILIVKLWALGDIIMATPLIPTLQRSFPGVQVDWMADSTHAEILRGHPGISHLDSLSTGSWRGKLRRGDIAGWLSEARWIHQQLKLRGYDAVINCHPDKTWTRVLCPAPIRVGLYSTATAPANRVLYTRSLVRPTNPPIHSTEHYLLAAQALGCTEMDYTMSIGRMENEKKYYDSFLQINGLRADKPIVVIAPRTTAENRCWEPDRFARLSDFLIEHCYAQIVITSSRKEIEFARQIADMTQRQVTIATDTSLLEYAALLRLASLVVSGDTSAMHLAAAVGTPYLALFGPTPFGERAPIIGVGKALFQPLHCAPCDAPVCTNPDFRECMKLHTVADVAEAAQELLRNSAPRMKNAPA